MFSPNCLFSDLGYKPFSFKLLLTKFVLIINSQLTFKFTFVKLIIPPNCEKIYRHVQCGRIASAALSFFLFSILRIGDIRYLEPVRKAAA